MMKPHISATVSLRAHNQPKKMADRIVRIAGLNLRYGSKTEAATMAATLFAMVTEIADFYVSAGAVTEEEGLEQMRLFVVGIQNTTDEYRQALAEEQAASVK